mmetsp:Transcript_47038/g.96197  ORF Transcript_47038/g.96197 Transcript_47038/m.96197 type:complete len:85 (-) Transcript_47038:138-392(-)
MPDTSLNFANLNPVAQMAKEAELQRLRQDAEAANADHNAMIAYSRFLQFKCNDEANAYKWKRRAVEALASKLSPNVTQMVSYHL